MRRLSTLSRHFLATGLACMLWACSSTPTYNATVFPYEIDQARVDKGDIKTVVIAHVNLGMASRTYLAKEAPRIDAMVSAYLKENGFKVLPQREFEQRWNSAVRSYGNPVDPTSGNVNMKTFAQIMTSVRDDMRDTGVDAFIFTDLVESGIELHVHPARPAAAEYRALADPLNVHGVRMHIHEPCAPRELLRRLTDYDVGWAGFNTTHNDAHLNTVLPNKAFEYVGCGLPVVSLPHDALADWIDGNGVGIVVQRASDVAAALQGMDLDALRDTVRAKRRDFTMEAAIGRLRDLYGAVSGSTSLTPTLHIPTLQP